MQMRKQGLWAVIIITLLAGALITTELAGQGAENQAVNLGSVVNSRDSDFGPIIAADGNKLFFTSDRAGGQGGQDIWMSDRLPDGTWSKPINLGPEVNTRYNEGPDTVTVDNRTIFFTRCDKIGNPGTCDIYKANLNETLNTWTNVENLGEAINSKFNDANASISYDGSRLYFVSDRPEEETKRRHWDIFVSRRENNRWTPAQRLGAPINTPGNEIHVMIHPDDVTFFFSSDGHGGFGGADVFQTKVDAAGNFSEPKNLGPFINTPENDMYFTIAGAGDLAYLASNRPTTECTTECGPGDPSCGCMEDIYSVPVTWIDTKGLLIVKGIVADKNTCGTPSADPVSGVAVYDIRTCVPINQALVRLADFMTDVAIKEDYTGPTGFYQVVIPAGKDYSITATASGYSFHSERFNVAQTQPYQVIEKNILLTPAIVGMTFTLNNIYFDFDKATLRPESKNELNNAIRFLQASPNIRIEIGGHTDAKGSDQYNIKLSLARAKSVRDYLIREGNIDPARIEAYGYGERMPIASNATDEGRQLNRRVEFKIIK